MCPLCSLSTPSIRPRPHHTVPQSLRIPGRCWEPAPCLPGSLPPPISHLPRAVRKVVQRAVTPQQLQGPLVVQDVARQGVAPQAAQGACVWGGWRGSDAGRGTHTTASERVSCAPRRLWSAAALAVCGRASCPAQPTVGPWSAAGLRNPAPRTCVRQTYPCRTSPRHADCSIGPHTTAAQCSMAHTSHRSMQHAAYTTQHTARSA